MEQKLQSELEAMSAAWSQIRCRCDGGFPSFPPNPQEWAELKEEFTLVSRPAPDYIRFVEAWAWVLYETWDFFLDQVGDWSLEVLNYLGPELSTTSYPDPDPLAVPVGVYEPGQAVRLLTGTNDVVLAGRRVIFWAAAARSPICCHRSAGYEITVRRWLPKAIEIIPFGEFGEGDDGVVRALPDLFDWIRQAFHELLTQRKTVGPTRAKKSTTKGDAEVKIIAALSRHHRYRHEGNINLEPMGVQDLARKAEVAPSTASAFFKREVGCHRQYRALCQHGNISYLASWLRRLNGDLSPDLSYGSDPNTRKTDE